MTLPSYFWLTDGEKLVNIGELLLKEEDGFPPADGEKMIEIDWPTLNGGLGLADSVAKLVKSGGWTLNDGDGLGLADAGLVELVKISDWSTLEGDDGLGLGDGTVELVTTN